MGLFQTVGSLPIGAYSFGAWVQAWYSQCSTRPHDPPYEADCNMPLTWAHMRVRVGLDPTGGQNPWSPNIVWSEEIEPYGEYVPIRTPPVSVWGGSATVFIYSESTHALKHEDAYFDSAFLGQVDSAARWMKWESSD